MAGFAFLYHYSKDEGTRVQEEKPLGQRTRNNSAGLEQRPTWAEGKCTHITAPPC